MNTPIIFDNQLTSTVSIADCTDCDGKFKHINLKPHMIPLGDKYIWCSNSVNIELISYTEVPTELVFCTFCKHAKAEKWVINTFHFPIVDNHCNIPSLKNVFANLSNLGYSGSHYMSHFVVLFNSSNPVEYRIQMLNNCIDESYDEIQNAKSTTIWDAQF
jgi:hypothetical protein